MVSRQCIYALAALVLVLSSGCKDEKSGDKAQPPATNPASPADGDQAADKAAADKAAADKAAADKAAADKAAADKPAPSATVTPTPGTVRVAVVFDGELLRSESRAVERMKKQLAKIAGLTMEVGDASADEKAAALGYFRARAPATLPTAWQSVETVVVVRIPAPVGKKPKRRSSGLGEVLVLRPPMLAPVYLESYTGEGNAGLSGKELGQWLRNVVTTIGKGASS